MISYLNGRLARKEPTHVIIDIHGIGYEVHIALTTYSAIKDKEQCKLFTYLHVKEDSHTLYGFHDEESRAMFLSLISISGVGPSTGLMVQSSLTSGELREAILSDDVRTIQSVKGIGAKTAKRIILELKDKLAKDGGISPDTHNLIHSRNTLRDEALSALFTLGINRQAAEKSVDRILKNSGNTVTLEELIKLALKNT
jgi:Holliday junction DNA helicase RuvA